jgi:hypothetical protein
MQDSDTEIRRTWEWMMLGAECLGMTSRITNQLGNFLGVAVMEDFTRFVAYCGIPGRNTQK